MTIQREPRPINAIKELRIRGSADVSVKRGEPSMAVIAENPEDVITEIRGGVLTISQRPTVMASLGSHGGVYVQGDCIQVGNISGGITINDGSCQITLGSGSIYNSGDMVKIGGMTMIGKRVKVEITLPNLPEASITGSGDLTLEDIDQDEIELKITGSGSINVSGEVKLLSAKISGSGDVDAKELKADIAELRVSGSGDIKAHVSEILSARVSGSGDIRVWGNPAKRDTRVSGSGDVKYLKCPIKA